MAENEAQKQTQPARPSGAQSSMRQPVNRTRQARTKSRFMPREKKHDFDKRIVAIRRVSRTYSGGKRMRLSVCVVVGDRKGKVGMGMGKGPDVVTAEEKAVNHARKHMVEIKLKGTTIPHAITYKKGAARIILKPAAPGTGVIAGSALRAVLEVVGVKDILTKVLGAPNVITNAYATLEALQKLKR